MPIMDRLLQQTAQEVQTRYYGKYQGLVVDNKDPDQMGRLKVNVPSLTGATEMEWALPCFPFGGLTEQGFFAVPEVGSSVWVEFEAGDVSRPIWTGVFWRTSAEVPSEARLNEPTTRVLKTPSGHVLQFDDAKGSERFRLAHPAGGEMTVDAQGNVDLKDPNGAHFALDAAGKKVLMEDANGNRIVMSSNGINLQDAFGNSMVTGASGLTLKAVTIDLQASQVLLGQGASEPVPKGLSLMTLFCAHTHPTAMGPSGPPLPPMTAGQMSMFVMTA